MRQRSGFRDTFSLGGWLFADLMLALMVLFLASNTVTGPIAALSTSTATETASPTVTATPTATPSATSTSTKTPVSGRTATFTHTATPTRTSTPTATATFTATRTPSPTSIPCQLTLVLLKHALTVTGSGNGNGPSAAQLRKAFAPFHGQRLGLLLTFGHAPDPDQGETLASTVNKQLAALLPDLFTPATIRESYHYIDTANTGPVDFNAYFFARSCGQR
jgi:hypothetical protein